MVAKVGSKFFKILNKQTLKRLPDREIFSKVTCHISIFLILLNITGRRL